MKRLFIYLSILVCSFFIGFTIPMKVGATSLAMPMIDNPIMWDLLGNLGLFGMNAGGATNTEPMSRFDDYIDYMNTQGINLEEVQVEDVSNAIPYTALNYYTANDVVVGNNVSMLQAIALGTQKLWQCRTAIGDFFYTTEKDAPYTATPTSSFVKVSDNYSKLFDTIAREETQDFTVSQPPRIEANVSRSVLSSDGIYSTTNRQDVFIGCFMNGSIIESVLISFNRELETVPRLCTFTIRYNPTFTYTYTPERFIYNWQYPNIVSQSMGIASYGGTVNTRVFANANEMYLYYNSLGRIEETTIGGTSVITDENNDVVILNPALDGQVIDGASIRDLLDTLLQGLRAGTLNPAYELVIPQDIVKELVDSIADVMEGDKPIPPFIDDLEEFEPPAIETLEDVIKLPTLIFTSIFEPYFSIFQINLLPIFLIVPAFIVFIIVIRVFIK